MKIILLAICLAFSLSFAFAKGKRRVTYKYKKYERFDFEALDVEGERSSPGDLSIDNRFKTEFKNKIPERKNFNRQMKKAVDSIL
ncbi:MAG: hypothetical protein CME65_07030 [Halobacteriovoraceae bacterium]|nr:hypothetical protein [Halobacteriovoraceae bacterium]|tara:strand:- start:6733 stop:6987 length:255 start_codon:yes stop_codon:yes gene_type:complete